MKFLKMFSKNLYYYVILPILALISFILLCILAIMITFLPGLIIQYFNIDNTMLVRILSFEYLVLIFSFMCGLSCHANGIYFKNIVVLTFTIFLGLSLISGYIVLCFIYHILLWITIIILIISGIVFLVIKSYKDIK